MLFSITDHSGDQGVHMLYVSALWTSMLTVPTYAWVVHVALPTIVILYIYFVGLPRHTSHASAAPSTHTMIAHGMCTDVEDTEVRNEWYTAANAIVLIGIYGVVLLVTLSIFDLYPILYPFILLWYALSDILDGKTAQRHNCHSALGIRIDRVRDRLLLVAPAAIFVQNFLFSAWIIPYCLLTLVELDTALIAAQAPNGVAAIHMVGKVRQALYIAILESVLILMHLTALATSMTLVYTTIALGTMVFISIVANVRIRVLATGILKK